MNNEPPVEVGAHTLREVAEGIRANRVTLTEHTMVIESIKEATSQTATASIKMAALTEERMALEREARAAAADAARSLAEAEAETKAKLATFFADNWRYVLLVTILVFYPQLFQQLQALGVLPSAPAAQTVAAPLPVPFIQPPPESIQ